MTRLERRKSMKPQQRKEIKAISGEGNIFRKIKHWAAPSRDSFGICAVRWRVIKLHPWPAFLFPKGKYHRSFALCGYNGCFDQVTLWSDYKHWPCEQKWLQRKGEFNIDFTYHMNQIKFARTSNHIKHKTKEPETKPQLLKDVIHGLKYLSQGYESFS